MIDHMLTHTHCALWVDMGLGKTVSALTAIQERQARWDVQNVLVVAPLRVADMVWPNEAKEWEHLQDMKVVRILGDVVERQRGAKARADVHVINRENLCWLVDYCMKVRKLKAWPWDMVVLDEASSFKAPNTKRFKALKQCLPWINFMVQLTGTPIPNSVQDAWSQLYLLDRGERLGRTISMFRNKWMYCVPGTHYYSTQLGADKQIKSLVKDICLSLRAEDYLDLPDTVEHIIPVRMSRKETNEYLTLKRKLVIQLHGEEVKAASAAVLWNKLLQLSNGAVYTEHPKWIQLHDHKINALLELHESTDQPLIIAYSYRPDKERIVKALTKAKASWRVLETDKDVEDWNAGKFNRLVLHPASAGHGLNLHKNGCRAICWFGLTPNLEHYLQANARIVGGHRALYSNRPATIYKILTQDTQDIVVNNLLKNKDKWQQGLMAATHEIINEETS